MSVETGERQRSGADSDKYYCHCGAFGVKLLSVQDLDSNSSKRTALPAFLFIAALSESQ